MNLIMESMVKVEHAKMHYI